MIKLELNLKEFLRSLEKSVFLRKNLNIIRSSLCKKKLLGLWNQAPVYNF